MAKRIEQLAAVKNIQKLDESKRKLLLDQISAKLFQVGLSDYAYNVWRVILPEDLFYESSRFLMARYVKDLSSGAGCEQN